MVPTVSWADPGQGIDRCRSPKDFTIDKRCYVRNFQKKIKPYNAVVKVSSPDGGWCSGTIVKNPNGKLYLYTAKHCVINAGFVPANGVWVTTQENKDFVADKYRVGNYNKDKEKKGVYAGDWALYSVPGGYEDINWTSISNNFDTPDAISYGDGYGVLKADEDIEKHGNVSFSMPYEATQIGYGALKIMSDAEIGEFKQKYIDYLEKEKGIKSDGTEWLYGFDFDDGGLYVGGEDWFGYGYNFLSYLAKKDYAYYKDTFVDRYLKQSECTYTSSGVRLNCQGWGGDSGCGVFDRVGNLMGIHNTGSGTIGGSNHAGSSKEGDVGFLSLDEKIFIQKDEK